MKKLSTIFLGLAMTISLTACGATGGQSSTEQQSQSNSSTAQNSSTQSSSESQGEATPDDSASGKTLVVYYSATNNTKAVAEYIAAETDGDLFEIVPTEPYSSADLNWTDRNSRVSREHDDTSLRVVELEKCLIHTGGQSHTSPWGGDQTAFTESMAEAGKAVSDYLDNGNRIVYISVLNNISIDCDCDGNPAEPDIHDIGILASTDPVAVDQAAIDLCFAAEGSESLQNRVERQNGLHTLEHAEEIGLGSREYTLVNIDE